MAKTATVIITFPNANRILFAGASTRVHPHGHLWLLNDSSPVTIEFDIKTPGYSFDDGGVGDPTQAFFTGPNPNPGAYDPCGGEFGNLSLSAGNTVFSFTSQNSDDQKYFYQLNFIAPGSLQVSTTDPIIVNRG